MYPLGFHSCWIGGGNYTTKLWEEKKSAQKATVWCDIWSRLLLQIISVMKKTNVTLN
jgi:hypothetical protein